MNRNTRTTKLAKNFWTELLEHDALQDCDNLQKLLTGCEIIAALDDLQLLAA